MNGSVFKSLSKIQHNLLTNYTETIHYGNDWSSATVIGKVKRETKEIQSSKEKFDITTLTLLEMKNLRFLRYCDYKEGHGLWLIPFWMFSYIDPEIEIIDTKGNTHIFKNIDNDNRGGYLAYGLIKEDEKNELEEFDELREVADKATQGDWWIDSHGSVMVSMDSLEIIFKPESDPKKAVRHKETGNLSCWRNDWDATYIATANPKKIKKLLAKLDEEIQKRKEAEYKINELKTKNDKSNKTN